MSISKRFRIKVFIAVFALFVMICGSVFVYGQSSDQNFPTPVTSNEISGTVRARDIGDSRQTTYYYTFNGSQGDIFINVVTNNFNGDIDVFAAEGLRPLTKIVVYADTADNETGRVIYLRRNEKIILRIQGRTPNDDPATFQIKFAGSFVPGTEIAQADAPKLPVVKKENESGVIVNSVGTIIGVKPKPTPEPAKAREEKPPVSEKTIAEQPVADETDAEKQAAETAEEKTEPQKSENPRVIITDELEKKDEAEQAETVADSEEPKAATEETPTSETPVETPPEITPQTIEEERTAEAVEPKKKETKKEKEANPLENIRLVVELRDGGRIERPISEILKFGVEKGVLTIIHKDGSISRYSILDVEKITVQ